MVDGRIINSHYCFTLHILKAAITHSLWTVLERMNSDIKRTNYLLIPGAAFEKTMEAETLSKLRSSCILNGIVTSALCGTELASVFMLYGLNGEKRLHLLLMQEELLKLMLGMLFTCYWLPMIKEYLLPLHTFLMY